MPGNPHGYLGWTAIYRLGDRHYAYFDYGSCIQGISIAESDGEILADYSRRENIRGYLYDAELWGLIVELDREDKVAGATYWSWFGGTPFSPPEFGPYSTGAYAHEHNSTAAEKRARLTELLTQNAPEDSRAKRALEILAREDSIREISEQGSAGGVA